MTKPARRYIDYVLKKPDSKFTTFGGFWAERPAEGWTAEAIRALVAERRPGAEWEGDYIRRAAAEGAKAAAFTVPQIGA